MSVTFDTSKLNSSTYKGVSFYTEESSLGSGKRLTTHNFIDSGTRTEENGNKDKTFTIKGFISGADYQTTKTALIKVLDSKGSGTLVDTYHGTLIVFVDTYSISESSKSNGKADLSITFKKAENNIDSTELTTMSTNSALNANAFSEFKENYNPNVGSDVLNDVATFIKTVYRATNNSIKFIESSDTSKEFLQNTINLIVEKTDANYVSNADNIVSDIIEINSAVNDFYSKNEISETDVKSSSNLIYSTIDETVNIDETNLNSIEKLALVNKKAFVNTQTIVQMQSLNEQLETVNFTTGDSFGDTKEAMLNTFEILNHSTSTPETLSELKVYKANYISFITQKYSELQDLEDIKQIVTVDIYTYILNKYNDISRISEVIENNDILDPLFISGDLQVLKK